MSKFPCIETTIDFLSKEDKFIRLWINQKAIPTEDALYEQEQLHFQDIQNYTHLPNEELIEKIIELVPNVNAIQIKEGKFGLVVYTVDFSNEAHG